MEATHFDDDLILARCRLGDLFYLYFSLLSYDYCLHVEFVGCWFKRENQVQFLFSFAPFTPLPGHPRMSSTPVCEDCQPPATISTSSTSETRLDSSSLAASVDPLLDQTTFEPPLLNEGSASGCPRVVIEFCDRCRVSKSLLLCPLTLPLLTCTDLL